VCVAAVFIVKFFVGIRYFVHIERAAVHGGELFRCRFIDLIILVVGIPVYFARFRAVYKKLATVCVGTAVCTRDRAGDVDEVFVKFVVIILAPNALAAGSVAKRVTALNHEIIDDAVESDAVIVAGKRQRFKAVHGFRCGIREKAHANGAVVRCQHTNLLAFFRHIELIAELFFVGLCQGL